ncbi:MAG TPA: FecR domain-containing protein [Thermoanaerobaculia bacterium]|jgi:ferric-dicitrate binding protein FerR (iron transport regulator)|nr:FecR domain-containing protein [Thermoanaerobaculia bacterium]
MSDRHDEWAVTGEPETAADPVARLVRFAGARPPVPEERAARVEMRVREAWQAGVVARRRFRWMSWGAGLAAAAGLAVAFGLLWRHASQPPPSPVLVATVERVSGSVTTAGAAGDRMPLLPGAQVFAGTPIETGADGRLALRLAAAAGATSPSLRVDVGSSARFLAASELRLDAGALYVDSQGGAPVHVHTPWAEVTERGTQFEVRVGAGGVRVRVREGAVELAGRQHADGTGAWRATAGAELLLAADGRLSRATVPVHGAAWDWVQEIAPSFQLEGSTLGEFLGWVGRETGWRVAWADPARAAAGAGTTLHGSIEGLPPEQALAAVLPTCGLADRRDGESVVVFASAR